MILSNLINWFVNKGGKPIPPGSIEKLSLVDQWYQRMWVRESCTGLSCDIFSCPGGDIPDEFEFPSQLVSLTIHDSTMSVLPDLILQLSNLTTLKIIGSNISKLPENIDKLSNLTNLT